MAKRLRHLTLSGVTDGRPPEYWQFDLAEGASDVASSARQIEEAYDERAFFLALFRAFIR